YRENSRSDCSGLVGMPVDGPARCTLTTTSGSSVMKASDIASDFRAMPGPDEPVTARLPAEAAPIVEPMAAISSSAWNVLTPYLRWRARAWGVSDAGAMGYEPEDIGRPAAWAATIRPEARAVLPVTFGDVPGGRVAGLSSNVTRVPSVVMPKLYPA